jgi:nucleoside 2-deoxyribosyltransferase
MTDRKKVYLASPLFSQMERRWNRIFANELERARPRLEVVLPQDFKVGGKFNDPKHFGAIYRECLEAVRDSALVLAVLEGPDVDSGVALEMGYALALGIPVVGLRTDYREQQEKGLNLMLSQACRYLVREYAFGEDVEQLAAAVARRIDKVIDPEADAPAAT